MTVAEYIAQEGKKLNPHIFMFTGGGAMYLNDAVGRAGINYICMHHEQALAMAAESYARLTGTPSMCIVTTGPGGLNTLNGVAGAWLDSIPMVIISGQVRIPMMRIGKLRQMGDQEVPIVDIVKPITKFAEVITKPEDVPYLFAKAVNISRTGRPGPVWLDIPMDIQRAEIPHQANIIVSIYEGLNIDYRINRISTWISNSKCPVILAGNGIRVSRAYEAFRDFITRVQAPVALSINAKDLLPTNHPQNIGVFGTLGYQETNDIIQEADLLLILGCRMNVRQTSYDFGEVGKNAFKIMVDIDKEELDKYIFVPDFKVNMDLVTFLGCCNSIGTYSSWLSDSIRRTRSASKFERTATLSTVAPKFSLADVMQAISTQIGDQPNNIVTANGMVSIYVIRYLNLNEHDRFITNSGLGSMGYGLPAAIGAALARDVRTICFEGDGSLQLNIQELQTIKYLDLPIKLFVANNNGYSSIKRTQENYFEGRYVGCSEKTGVSFPDLREVAKAYKIPYVSLSTLVDCERGVREALEQKGPVIIEVRAFPDEIPYKADYKIRRE